ncbi:hypothetical protein EMVG_00089 [Emiliania huxleyi virus PS401]|jgi:phosphorylcholine metabolism protein LicD|nr:hypothetical protein EMVG_00089 [Emiliania huxleyi virus PS401]
MCLIQKQETCRELLTLWVGLAREARLVYYAYSGTLLGVMRHRDFVPWDDDVDLCVDASDMQRFMQLPLPADVQLHPSPKGACYRLTLDGRAGFVDLFPVTVSEGMVQYSLAAARELFPQDTAPEGDVFPLRSGQFGDFCLPIPRRSERCLERMYGDWRSPVVYAPHGE